MLICEALYYLDAGLSKKRNLTVPPVPNHDFSQDKYGIFACLASSNKIETSASIISTCLLVTITS